MIKKYCDVCNKEVDSLTEYTLPKSENIFAEDKFGTKLAIAGQTCNPVKKELCPRCALYLAKFIDQYLLPIVNMHWLCLKRVDFLLMIQKKVFL